jgi:hypothetical protein
VEHGQLLPFRPIGAVGASLFVALPILFNQPLNLPSPGAGLDGPMSIHVEVRELANYGQCRREPIGQDQGNGCIEGVPWLMKVPSDNADRR